MRDISRTFGQIFTEPSMNITLSVTTTGVQNVKAQDHARLEIDLKASWRGVTIFSTPVV